MTHPTTTPTPRICPNCDGFATAAITTGSRDDNRNTRLTKWLNDGIPPAQVAEWAGNSVAVLLPT
ncbi:hypothetical protein [Streptomyces tibetensis]|uniref:hypothetical protein n=1 Tax=Streptomyces tibetensis TaxID=2382123 RepID=UPI0033D06B11